MVEVDAPFAAQVVERCRRQLLDSHDFVDLVSQLQGADPLVAIDALTQLAQANSEVGDLARARLAEARRTRPKPAPSPLPIVHPLEYHWRFSPDTVTRLLARIKELSQGGDRIVFLGTPSVYRAALEDLDDRELLLLDRDKRVIQTLSDSGPGEVSLVDLERDHVEELGAAVCLADPPWYPNAMAAFANAAAVMLATGGCLLLGFPGPLTRPGVEAERDLFLAAAANDALELSSCHQLEVTYETPPFEVAAMAAAGLPCPPELWRRGDLLELRRDGTRVGRRPVSDSRRWHAFELEQIPLWVRPSAPAAGQEVLGSLVEDDILPSVSRRVEIRSKVALWTSRNRVFSSTDPERLASIVSALVAQRAPEAVDHEVVARIREIVDLERREHQLPARARVG